MVGRFAPILGESDEIRAVRDRAERLLQNAGQTGRLPTVLILGRTGTGKGLLAQCLHRASPRADRPFVEVNCAAIPETMLEAELFGFERGAFTDARQPKPGLIEVAHGGILFLDEVGALSLALQAKLLTALEERTIRRLGSTSNRSVDVWFIAATNEDLDGAMREGRFRRDLYHRLAVVKLELPDLCRRKGDIRVLAVHFLQKACTDYGLAPKRLAPDAQDALERYPFPGNVRELANLMERIALLVESATVTAADLGLPAATAGESLVAAADIDNTSKSSADSVVTAPDHGRSAGTPGEALVPGSDLARSSRAGADIPVAASGAGLPAEADRESVTPPAPRKARHREVMHDVERGQLQRALEATDWNLSRAAVQLGLARNTLRHRMQRLGLIRKGQGDSAVRAEPERTLPARGAPSADRRQWEPRALTFLRVAFDLHPRSALRSAMDEIRALAVEKIMSFGGLIETTPDEYVEAVFGVEPIEDGPSRAANAALAVRAAVRKAAGPGETPSTVRAAIHARRCLIDPGGAEIFVDPAEQGDAGHVLAALLRSAGADTILASGAAVALLERRFTVQPDAVPAVDARAGRIVGRAVSALGIRDAPPPPFVGREPELDLLRAAFARAVAGKGQVVEITGEPGCGKSRLSYEFRREVLAGGGPDVRYAEALCASHGAATPYAPIADLVRGTCGAFDVDDPDLGAGRVQRFARTLPGYQAEHVPYLLHLLGLLREEPLRAPESPRHGDEPETVRAYTFEAAKQLWLQLAAQHPTVLLVEDLHWSDSISQKLLAALVEELPSARLLLVVTYRPDFVPWPARPHVIRKALDPLPTRASLEVVRGVLGTTGADRYVEQLILERAGGNPFFLEELALAARDQGAQAMTSVPPRIEGVLGARIERLPPAERRLLEAAAVIGREFSAALLLRLVDLPVDEARQQLAALQAAGFVHERASGPGSVYAFKHALIQQVAYDGLRPPRRRALHARTFECLEVAPEGVTPVEQLADHAFRAERWEPAFEYLRQAGQKAFARLANQEALACFRQAVEALGHLDEDATPQTAIDLRFELRSTLFLRGELGAVESELIEAARLAKRLENGAQLDRASTYLMHYYWITGQPDNLRTYAERVRHVATQSADPALRLTANQYVGLAHMTSGDYRAAAAFLRTAVDSIPESQRSERLGQPGYPYVTTRGYLALCMADQGEFQAGIKLAEEGIPVANAIPHRYSLGIVSWDLAYLYCVKGEIEPAIHLLHVCADVHDPDRQASGRTASDPIESARKSTFVLSGPRLIWLLGHAYGLAGRLDLAIDLMEEALARSRSVGMLVYDALTAVHLAEAYLRSGRVEEALATGEGALALAERREQRGYRAYALRLLAEVFAHPSAPDPVAAEERYRRALEEAQTLGMRPLEARCHLGLASLGTGDAATAHGARAAAILRDLDMRVPFEPIVT